MSDFKQKFFQKEITRKKIAKWAIDLIDDYLENHESDNTIKAISNEFYKITLSDDSCFYFDTKIELFTFGLLIYKFRKFVCVDVAKFEKVLNAEKSFEVVRNNNAGIIEDLTDEFLELV